MLKASLHVFPGLDDPAQPPDSPTTILAKLCATRYWQFPLLSTSILTLIWAKTGAVKPYPSIKSNNKSERINLDNL